MKLVILESPFAADTPEEIEANIAYARKCIRDSLSRGEAPIASHLLYTQDGILDDTIPHEREWGINAGLAWKEVAHGSVVYTDRGISKGMEYGIAAAKKAGRSVEMRSIEGDDHVAVADPTRLTMEDVFGKIIENEHGDPIGREDGMVVGKQNTICPIWNDEIPYKSTTVVCHPHQVDQVEYWMTYVKGGDCISKTVILEDGRVAIRGDYTCW
jgi:hypothetical protein